MARKAKSSVAETVATQAHDVPTWLLDTNYNGLSFHVSQAFFPPKSAWDGLKRALKAMFKESVWDHLAGTVSAPFALGENKTEAIKVIDDRGTELTSSRSSKNARRSRRV